METPAETAEDSGAWRIPLFATLNFLMGCRALYFGVFAAFEDRGTDGDVGRWARNTLIAFTVCVALMQIFGSCGLLKRRPWGILMTAGAGSAILLMNAIALVIAGATFSEWSTSHVSGAMALSSLMQFTLCVYWSICLMVLLSSSVQRQVGVVDSRRLRHQARRVMVLTAIPAALICFWRWMDH